MDGSKRNDKALFADKGKKGKGKGKAKAKKGDDDAMDIDEGDEAAQDGGGGGGVKGGRGSKGAMYYRVKCKDNGVGMQHKVGYGGGSTHPYVPRSQPPHSHHNHRIPTHLLERKKNHHPPLCTYPTTITPLTSTNVPQGHT